MARIDGTAGVGYLLRPEFVLPPLMFGEEEIEALVLGSRWIAERADPALAAAARSALAKIGAVLPAELRPTLDGTSLFVGPGGDAPAGDADLAAIRRTIRTERRLDIDYRGPDGTLTACSRHRHPVTGRGAGHGELALTVADASAVRGLHADWSARGLTIAQPPTAMDFGFTFVALDPDGHRLRVFAPAGA